MKVYDVLIEVMTNESLESWYHPFGFTHSRCTVNEVEIILHSNGKIGFANKIYQGWPFSTRKGRNLYKFVRLSCGVSDNQLSMERKELAKLGYTEKIDV